MGNKGSPFEREICKRLSLWWTDDERNDVFWRTAGSGGMATNRGRFTFGQHGDIQATDPIGQPLIDVCSIEVKRGHEQANVGDVLDRRMVGKLRLWENHILQAMRQATEAKAFGWWLISRRDRREGLIFLSWKFYQVLALRAPDLDLVEPWLRFKPITPNLGKRPIPHVFATSLDEFLDVVRPEHILHIHKKLKRS